MDSEYFSKMTKLGHTPTDGPEGIGGLPIRHSIALKLLYVNTSSKVVGVPPTRFFNGFVNF